MRCYFFIYLSIYLSVLLACLIWKSFPNYVVCFRLHTDTVTAIIFVKSIHVYITVLSCVLTT